MRILINERISPHKYKTPEGYLVCVDSILARTGKQEYYRDEIFHDGSNELVNIDRSEKEVFDDKTIASFENKPITVEHPSVDVNAENHKDLAVGFVRDVHRGEFEGQPVLLGTLVITDAQTIEEIENGEHTDLSCGYDCIIEDNDNPEQKQIRGNHVALCQEGRAGIARIVDSVKDDYYGNVEESKLRKSKDFKLKELFKELDEVKGYPMSVYKENLIHDIKNQITARVKQLKSVPNDIYDSIKDEGIIKIKNLNFGEKVKIGVSGDNKILVFIGTKNGEYLFRVDGTQEIISYDDPTIPCRLVDSIKDEKVYMYRGYKITEKPQTMEEMFGHKQYDYVYEIEGINFPNLSLEAAKRKIDKHIAAGKLEARDGVGERYRVVHNSPAGEYVYETDDLKDAVEELRALGRAYYIEDIKENKKYKLKEAENMIKDDNIQYKDYVIYPWHEEFRAIKHGRSSFDIVGKSVEEVKARIDKEESFVKDSVITVPNMSFKEMKDYCEMYDVNVYNTGVAGKYRIEGRDIKEVIEELKADGYIEDSVKDDGHSYRIFREDLMNANSDKDAKEIFNKIKKAYSKGELEHEEYVTLAKVYKNNYDWESGDLNLKDSEKENSVEDVPVGENIKTEVRKINMYGTSHNGRLESLKGDVNLYKTSDDKEIILKRIKNLLKDLNEDYKYDLKYVKEINPEDKDEDNLPTINNVKRHYRKGVDNVVKALPSNLGVHGIVDSKLIKIAKVAKQIKK